MDREGDREEGDVWIFAVELEHESILCKGETDEVKMLKGKGHLGTANGDSQKQS